MRCPLIGITTSLDMEENTFFSKCSYAESIAKAGGLPLLIPSDEAIGKAAEYAGCLDGILLAGGGDIHPHYFGEEPLDGFPMGEILPQRDGFEIELYRKAAENRMPILGICRGIQVMAAAAGGSIWQDIDTQIDREQRVRHMQKAPDWCETHMVRLFPGTKLGEIYHAERIMTNSFHHQSVKSLPKNYRISAQSEDGVIEGIESTELPFGVGVQWHPERARDARTAILFCTFVRNAAQYGMEKEGRI